MMDVLRRALFEESWLDGLAADCEDSAAAAVLETAEQSLAAALSHIVAAASALAGGGEFAAIDALLQVETGVLPAAARQAWGVAEQAMRETAYKRRHLMPRFRRLLDRIDEAHEAAAAACSKARWSLMTARVLAHPGHPSGPVQGEGTRYVKGGFYDARAAAALPPDDRVRADRTLKRLGEAPIPAELDLRPLSGDAVLSSMKAGGRNRFILRAAFDRGGPLLVVEDVGPER